MTDTTALTVTYTYESWEIPPRCRKARAVVREATVTIDIPTVTSAQAPVVMRVPTSTWGADARMAELRGFDGHLFEPMTTERVFDTWPLEAPSVQAGSDQFPLQQRADYAHAPQVTGEARVREGFSGYLIVDGMVWVRSDEPVYEVSTTGLGDDHGGTHLDIRRWTHDELMTHPATDRDAAVAHALEVASARGNTRTQWIVETNRIEVLDPAYVRTPHRAALLLEKEGVVQDLVDQARAALDRTDISLRDRVTDAASLLHRAREAAWQL